jgi:hypothetical protein
MAFLQARPDEHHETNLGEDVILEIAQPDTADCAE